MSGPQNSNTPALKDSAARRPIVVVADDLSGAAELAGAALNRGLSAEVQTVFSSATDAEVVCVDTDTRSLPATEATRVVGRFARAVAAARPAWIYKKCDSVLRGNVLAEMRAIMAVTGETRAVLISANPSRGRVIRGGDYFVNGQRLHETVFANDPEHPRCTSRVAELLGGDLSGVRAPDAENKADLAHQAGMVDDGTLAAGGVEFFEALLSTRAAERAKRPTHSMAPRPIGDELARSTLLVCGSAASWAKRCQRAVARGLPVFTLPHDEGVVVRALRLNGFALLGIGESVATQRLAPSALVETLARTVVGVLRELPVARLLLEGGATAAAVVRELGWTRLRACEPCAPGIGALRRAGEAGPLLFIKPGSYDWPESWWPPYRADSDG